MGFGGEGGTGAGGGGWGVNNSYLAGTAPAMTASDRLMMLSMALSPQMRETYGSLLSAMQQRKYREEMAEYRREQQALREEAAAEKKADAAAYGDLSKAFAPFTEVTGTRPTPGEFPEMAYPEAEATTERTSDTLAGLQDRIVTGDPEALRRFADVFGFDVDTGNSGMSAGVPPREPSEDFGVEPRGGGPVPPPSGGVTPVTTSRLPSRVEALQRAEGKPRLAKLVAEHAQKFLAEPSQEAARRAAWQEKTARILALPPDEQAKAFYDAAIAEHPPGVQPLKPPEAPGVAADRKAAAQHYAGQLARIVQTIPPDLRKRYDVLSAIAHAEAGLNAFAQGETTKKEFVSELNQFATGLRTIQSGERTGAEARTRTGMMRERLNATLARAEKATTGRAAERELTFAIRLRDRILAQISSGEFTGDQAALEAEVKVWNARISKLMRDLKAKTEAEGAGASKAVPVPVPTPPPSGAKKGGTVTDYLQGP